MVEGIILPLGYVEINKWKGSICLTISAKKNDKEIIGIIEIQHIIV